MYKFAIKLIALGFLIVSPSVADEDHIPDLIEEVNMHALTGDPDSLRNLGMMLRRMNRLRSSDAKYEDVFLHTQNVMLEIPSHASYFGDKIWEEYMPFKDKNLPSRPGSLHRYTQELMYGMRTLALLPSPESIAVLRGMLDEEWQPVPAEGSRVLYPSPLAASAVWTLASLPLRQLPTAPFERYEAMGKLPQWQAWFLEIMSGTLTFSFKGHAVEYRFLPDGSWETIPIANPPDDAPRRQVAIPPAKSNTNNALPPQSNPPEDARSTSRRWLWIGIAAIFVVACSVWRPAREIKP